MEQSKLDDSNRLSDDLSYLLCNDTNSDISFQVGNQNFPAHRAIIEARCPNLLNADLKPAPKSSGLHLAKSQKKSQKRIIVLENMSKEVMEALLTYIYTGKTSANDYTIKHLLATSINYHLDQLSRICSETIISKLTVQNCIDYLIFVDDSSVEALKDKIVEFIAHNKNEVVLNRKSNKLLNLKNSHGHLLEKLYLYPEA